MTANLPWFRMYSEAVDDEKLRLIAFEDRWHFVALLCCKAKGILDDGGEMLHRKIAVKLGLDLRALDEVARRLAEVGLIEENTLQPLKWDDRQYRSDSSTERVRSYRERLKQVAKRSGNVTVTAQDTDTDTEKEVNTIVGNLADALPTGFVRFWESWPSSPRKVGKSACAKKWRAAKLDRSADQIIAHVEAMKATKQWRDGFDPAPLTYINQQRWLDGAPCQSHSMFPADNPFAGCQ